MSILHHTTEDCNSSGNIFSQSSHNSDLQQPATVTHGLTLDILQTVLGCIDFVKFRDLLKFRAIGSKIKSFTVKALKRFRKLLKGNYPQKPIAEVRELNILIPVVDIPQAVLQNPEAALQAKYENFLTNYPEAKLIYEHWKDLELSGVHDAIKALNCVSVEGNTTYAYILTNTSVKDRINTGALNRGTMGAYSHLYAGGMFFKTVDLINGSDESEWGQLKPNTPRLKEGKLVKYEAPLKKQTELYALRLPRFIKEKFCDDPLVLDGQDWEFWKYVRDNGLTIVVTEGSKKAGALLSQGILAIAFSGIWTWGKAEKDGSNRTTNREIIPAFQYFLDVPREYIICFDSDIKHKTITDVTKAINALAFKIKDSQSTVSVLHWNNVLGKGIDDVIVKHGKDYLDFILQGKLPFIEWGALNLNKLLMSVDDIINLSKVGDLKIPENKNLIFIKSAKATGKTTSIAKWLEAWFAGGGRALVISHRIQLGKALCGKFGLPYIDDKTEQSLINKMVYGYGLCINSLHQYSQAHFNPDNWKGAVVILDEVCQLILHLLTDPNMKQQRVRVINNLKTLLTTVIKSGGKIICADADLNDVAVNFISGLIDGSYNRHILLNEYKYEQPWRICNFTQTTPAALLKVAFDQLEQGKRLFFCLSAQKISSPLGSQYLVKEINKRFPDLKVLVIDSHTVADPQHPAYKCTESIDIYDPTTGIKTETKNINNVLEQYDVVLATSVIETGVDITVNRFDGVFGIFNGIQTANTVRQFLARYRPTVPRYIWINKRGMSRTGNGQIWANGILNDEKARQSEILKNLQLAGITEDLETGNYFTPCLTAWAKTGAFNNYINRKYQYHILEDLKAEGHIIANDNLPPLPGDDVELLALPSQTEQKEFRSELSEGCKEAYRVDRVEITEAEDIDPKQLETLGKQREMTVKERKEYRKAYVKQSYGLETVTEELLKADDKRLYGRLQLLYSWSKGRELLPKMDLMKAEKAYRYGDGQVYLPDIKSLKNKVEALDLLGFDKLLELDDFEVHDNEVLNNCFEVILDNFPKFQKLFFPESYKWKIEDEILTDPLAMAQRIVGWVGLSFVKGRRMGTDGKRVQRWSKPINKVVDVNQVMEYWHTRDLEKLAEHETKKAKERELMEEMGINSTTEFFQTVPNYEPNRETVTGNESYGIPPTLDVESLNVMLQNRTKAEAKAFTEIILPQVVDGFTLTSEHIDVIPVVKQLVAGKVAQCREDVKMLADEFLKALRGSIDLVKVVAHVDNVLADDLSCQMLADCY